MEHSRKKNKRRNLIILAFIGLLIIIGIISLLLKKQNTFPKSLGVVIKNNGYYLEVAQSNQETKKGLSNRDQLCPNCGMLFVFNKEDQHDFWMKDTHIPLDIIWINSKKEIVKIIVSAKTDSETIYSNKAPAQYVIELPANESLKLNLQVGDTIPIFDQ